MPPTEGSYQNWLRGPICVLLFPSSDRLWRLQKSLEVAGSDLGALDGIAVTKGPGLSGSLIIGLSLAKALALATQKSLIGVHHMEGHIFSNLIENDIEVPLLVLLVSGGHTELVLVSHLGHYEILGRTRDDAAGEAFDKVAKLLDLLPDQGAVMGGKVVAELAEKGNPEAIKFPRALKRDNGFDFSFSGLKTAVLNYVRQRDEDEIADQLPDIAASFQAAVVDALVEKTIRASEHTGIKAVALAGGVAANKSLRHRQQDEVEARKGKLYCPSPALCTDNAAMIAAAGLFHLSRGERSDLSIDVTPRLSL